MVSRRLEHFGACHRWCAPWRPKQRREALEPRAAFLSGFANLDHVAEQVVRASTHLFEALSHARPGAHSMLKPLD